MRPGESIGARIAQTRKLRGLTQRAFARRANVSYSLVTKVEAGHVPASPAFLNTDEDVEKFRGAGLEPEQVAQIRDARVERYRISAIEAS